MTIYENHSFNEGPLFVAEISGNHLGELNRCLDLISVAKDSGANAVKFQTFIPEKMTLDIDLPEFRVSNEHALWGGQKLIDLYRQTATPLEWHEELFNHSRNLGLIPFSTPFDLESVDLLESLGCSIYKIASLESSDITLIKKVAQTMKPIIISTGATYFEEIQDAVDACLSVGNANITLLICTSAYPALPKDANLNRLQSLKKNFKVSIGISDHTLGIGTSIAAIALGAKVVEKHLTDSRLSGGPDAAFSLEPHEFKMLVAEGRSAFQSLGNEEWLITNSEKESRRLRRSLYIINDVSKEEVVSLSNISAIRPGLGISPKHLDSVIGKKFKSNYKKGLPLSFEMLES